MFSSNPGSSTNRNPSGMDFSQLYGASEIGGGVGGLLSSLFGGNQSDAYKDAMKQMGKYTDKAASYQMPFYNAGVEDIDKYQSWLDSMSNPTEFINNLMGGYSESPYAKYEQDQAMRSAKNMGSASGLSGSTPLQLQAQENAENISSKDMDQWLQDVLGINTEYGSGLDKMIGRGQSSANSLTSLFEQLAKGMSSGAYGSKMSDINKNAGIFGDLGSIGAGIGALFL